MRHTGPLAVALLSLLGGCDPPGRAGSDGAPGAPDLGGGGGGADLGSPAVTDCASAAALRSYVGCDYWPTVVANNVWSTFDFAVVVANAGATVAQITVDGPDGFHAAQAVPPNELAKVYLPWVADLKGPDFDVCTAEMPLSASVRHARGAYHLVSSAPVSVYQFNALEYKVAGGPAGKSWSGCPGYQMCGGGNMTAGRAVGCFAFSNDASLLLPSTAMTGNYRVTGRNGQGDGASIPPMNTYFAVTATADGTVVHLKLSPTGEALAGGGLGPIAAGGAASFTLDAGDVMEVVAPGRQDVDLSGSLVQASRPVQVISGAPCLSTPVHAQACDHLEESVFPAETLGRHYVVSVPTGPRGTPIGHVVRLYGNVDGTHLSFTPPVANAPATLAAGQVVDLGTVAQDFEVAGDQPFAVGSFMLGGTLVDASTPQEMREGDPSQSLAIAVEQYRLKYVFLAPDDYDFSFVDVTQPVGTTLTLDGAAVAIPPVTVAGTAFQVVRIPLSSASGGAHLLEASAPVGIQVIGYGLYTSYQYPGGSDLQAIAPPPIF